MNFTEFKNELNLGLEKLNIFLEEEQINQFYKYMNILIEWNKNINLTAITDPKEVILKHFIDSMYVLKNIEISSNSSVIDIGTGAGFPGIPLKIVRKDLNVTLLDSLNKRIMFLDNVINNLGLKDISTIHGRAEEMGKNKKYREMFDYAISRAVANLTVLSEYMIPFVKLGGKSICMKGGNIKEELESSQKALGILGGNLIHVEEFNLLDTDIKRSLIIIEKCKITPIKYPRKPGTPVKEPLI